MTTHDTARVDHARANLESCRVKVDKLAGHLDGAREAGAEEKAGKLAEQHDGAVAALRDAEDELAAAEAAEPVPFVEPTEHVVVHAGLASGDGKAASV